MEKTDCFEVGRISKTFGYKGEVIASLRNGFFETIKKEGSVFIETDGELVPYFFAEIEEEGGEYCHLTFDDINDVDQARPLCGLEMWLPREVIPSEVMAAVLELQVAGYEVSDVKYGELGKAIALESYPQHLVLKIKHGRREILVPYVEAYIKSVDHVQKRIVLCAPEGLIDAYLQ
jgi:16S rRNA processing protein RimM